MIFDFVLRPALSRMLVVLAVFAFAGMSVSNSQAKTITVKTGQRAQVGIIGPYSLANCSTLLTNPSAKGKARNGKVTIQWINHTIAKGSCKGRSVKVIIVWYQPDKGFTGRDTVTVSYFGPRGTRYTESSATGPTARKFNVKVK